MTTPPLRDEPQSVRVPVAWLVEADAINYRGVTLIDPATAEGAWDGFIATPLYPAAPKDASYIARAMELAEALAKAEREYIHHEGVESVSVGDAVDITRAALRRHLEGGGSE